MNQGREVERRSGSTTDRWSHRGCKRPTRGATTLRALLLVVLLGSAGVSLGAFTWPWEVGGPWPTSSATPVAALVRPPVESVVAGGDRDLHFAVFGDQRALADGEWQELIAAIDRFRSSKPLDFLIDTGDIVNDGAWADQFVFLGNLLEPVADLPYLVAVGNHEVRNNRDPIARANTAAFLAGAHPGFGPERFYFRKDLGPCRFFFLDSNDFVYGDDGGGVGDPDDRAGEKGDVHGPADGGVGDVVPGGRLSGSTGPVPESRAAAQLDWLASEFAEPELPGTSTIVVVHHPIIQTSEKHREQAVALWNYGSDEGKLRDLFVAGGVDVILTGHTHTYERFVLSHGGARMHVINVSGRPRTSFLWIGDGARRPEDVRGEEAAWFPAHGFDLAGWTVAQEAVMDGDERNQFAVFEIAEGAKPRMSVYVLDDDDPSGYSLLESAWLE